MEQQMQKAPREIKVHTEKFSLKRGQIVIGFSLEKKKGHVKALSLVQRNARERNAYPFLLTEKEKGDTVKYRGKLDAGQLKLEVAFWDVVATVDPPQKGTVQEVYDAILGGLSAKLKLWLILFPRWTKTPDGHLIYPFVNGARQFTIQYRLYDRRYDSYLFLAKEYLALFCYFVLKPFWDRKKIWLICEKFAAMAQDNALYFFRYCMKELPAEEKKHIFYVIDKQAADYQAVKEYDKNVIQFMSFRYMIYLCAAQYLISTDAIRHFYIWDSPNSVYKVLYQARKNLIFLQHGVMGFKQCHRTYHKSGGNRVARFVVSSQPERDIIEKYFEYDREDIIITGLARWDVLENKADEKEKQILVMPTWRLWLEYASDELFLQSDYYQKYKAFLQDDKLHALLEQYDITLYFYIHPKFRAYIEKVAVGCPRILLIPFGERPLNELLMSCHMLITDYSSVAWDVYHQEKPVIFYPFDLDVYEAMQGSYLDMEKDAFGDVVYTEEALLEAIRYYAGNGFSEKACFAARRDVLLPLRDQNNSRRIYEEIKKAQLPSKWRQRLKDGI